MSIQLREMKPEDVERCGTICYQAFKNIAEKHNFRPDFPTAEAAIQMTEGFVANPGAFSIVAEQDGRIVGSNHLWEYDAIRAVGQ